MEYIAIAVAILVIAVVTAAGLLVSRPRRTPPAPTVRPDEVAHDLRGPQPPGAGTATVTAPAPPAPPTDTVVAPDAAVAPEATVAPPDAAPPATAVEVPEPTAGRLVRLRARLARSQNALGRGLLELLSGDRLDESVWEQVEDTLLLADVGVGATQQIVASLRERVKVLGARTPAHVRTLLRDELLVALGPDADRSLRTAAHDGHPATVLVVGVNGTGKTTTCGKLARVLVADGRRVLLAAADTFRAAAADQLSTWGERVGAATVRGPEGGDPASVAFDAVKRGREEAVDTVLIDTAGRLHTKQGLMDELAKVKRVVERQAAIDEVLLVLDATTGQNGVTQARVFTEAVDVTGIVLTKLDGTAKGGIVVAVQRDLGVPVKLVGLGEGPDDLAPFEPEPFVDALLADPGEAAA